MANDQISNMERATVELLWDYQLDGQNDQAQFATWEDMARDIRHLSGRSEWAGIMRECLQTLEGVSL